MLRGNSVDEAGEVVEAFTTWHRSDRIALDVNVIEPFVGPAPPPPDAAGPSEAARIRELEATLARALATLRSLGR